MFKRVTAIIISALFIFIFLSGCSTKTQAQPKGGLKITSWSSGVGGG